MKDNKPPLLTRPLLIFMGTMILANIAGRMHEALLPLYIQSLGANIGQVGLFFTLGAVAPLAFQILGGWLSDSLGRWQAVAIGSIAGVAGYVVFIVAPTWQWLLLAMATGAMARAFVGPSYQAFIAEQSTEETRGRVYGLADGLFMVVGVIGPPVGGYLSEHYGFKEMFVAAGALYTFATVIRLFMARSARRAAAATTDSRGKPSLAGLKNSLVALAGLITAGGIVTWIMIADGSYDVTFRLALELQPLYMHNIASLTNSQIGWLASISSATMMLFIMPGGWLSDKWGERVGLVGGFLLLAIGMGIFLVSRTFVGFAAAWFMFGFGDALITPAHNALISKAVPHKLRGTAFGFFATSLGLVSLPAPYIGALMWERFGPQAPFFVPIAAALILMPIMWVKFKFPKADAETQSITKAAVPEA